MEKYDTGEKRKLSSHTNNKTKEEQKVAIRFVTFCKIFGDIIEITLQSTPLIYSFWSPRTATLQKKKRKKYVNVEAIKGIIR